jgi:hypothetical protein
MVVGSRWHKNLVLYYSFEWEDGSKVIDTSGNGNDGRLYGAGYADGFADGQGMVFDGQDDRIHISGIHLQIFTFSAVVKPNITDDLLDTERLFLLTGDKGHYALEVNASGKLQFRCSVHGRQARIDEDDRQSQIDGWTRIAATCDGLTVRLYRNGELSGQGRILGDDIAGIAFIGGTDAHRGGFWDGMIDEVALFNRVLSSEEIREFHQATSDGALGRYLFAPKEKSFSDRLTSVEVPEMGEDVVLHYSFDKDYGDEVLDGSGRGHHARAHGTRYVSDGRSGGALSFDGQDDFLSTPDIHLDSFTLSAFVKTLLPANKPNTNNRRLFLLYDGPRYFALQGNSAGSIGLDVTGHRGVDEYGWKFEAHRWTHVVVTYERPTVKIYKDGQLTQAGHVETGSVTGTLYIGGTDKHWGRFWHGLMDEVIIFNRALTQKEIEEFCLMIGEPAYGETKQEKAIAEI